MEGVALGGLDLSRVRAVRSLRRLSPPRVLTRWAVTVRDWRRTTRFRRFWASRGSSVAGWDRSPIHTSDSAGVRGDLVCVGTWCEQHRLTVLPLATKALTSREKANGIRAQKRRCSWWC